MDNDHSDFTGVLLTCPLYRRGSWGAERMPDLGYEQAVVTQSLSGPPGDTALTGHRTAEPPSLLTGSAGAFPEAAMALPHHCTHCCLYPTPLCPEWGLQPGRHSSTHKPTQPIGSPVPPTWVSVWLLRTTNWTQPFPRRPLSTSRPLRAAIGFTGDGHPRRPLGAEASPHCKPPSPTASSLSADVRAARLSPPSTCRQPARQAGRRKQLEAVTHLALLNTKESLTMTTGPSSGHSESWYWLQSSHPADRQPASGAEAPEDTAGLQPSGGDRRCSPQIQNGANIGRAPKEKTRLYGTLKACRAPSKVTKNEIFPRNDNK